MRRRSGNVSSPTPTTNPTSTTPTRIRRRRGGPDGDGPAEVPNSVSGGELTQGVLRALPVDPVRKIAERRPSVGDPLLPSKSLKTLGFRLKYLQSCEL
jgi:hypothetical protein